MVLSVTVPPVVNKKQSSYMCQIYTADLVSPVGAFIGGSISYVILNYLIMSVLLI